MPITAHPVYKTNAAADVLNAIKNSASIDYRNYVPYCAPDGSDIRKIGAVLADYPALQNEFISALINRIALTFVVSHDWSNAWSAFKRGKLEFGDVVEEIFIDLCDPIMYDPANAESKVFERVAPKVRSAFHVTNYQRTYPQTIQRKDLERAFQSAESMDSFIQSIIQKMYTSMEYDEFLVMKMLLLRAVLDGRTKADVIDAIAGSGQGQKNILEKVREESGLLQFLNKNYNEMGIYGTCPIENQVIIMDAETKAKIDVEALATLFHLEKAEVEQRIVLVDYFSKLDTDRLAKIFKDDSKYVTDGAFTYITSTELTKLGNLKLVLMDERWWQCYDKYTLMGNIENPMGMYWNYFLNVGKCIAHSPFMAILSIWDDAVTTQSLKAYIGTTEQTIVSKGLSVAKTGVDLILKLDAVGFNYKMDMSRLGGTNTGSAWDKANSTVKVKAEASKTTIVYDVEGNTLLTITTAS